MKKEDYLEMANTEEHNFQNEPHFEIVELISNGRLKGFFVWKHFIFILS